MHFSFSLLLGYFSFSLLLGYSYIINIKFEITNNVEETEIKKEFSKGRRGGKYGFKKKGGRKFSKKQQSSMANEFFKRVGVGIEGPELYVNIIERLGLYASTQFKNGSNMKKCLMKENW